MLTLDESDISEAGKSGIRVRGLKPIQKPKDPHHEMIAAIQEMAEALVSAVKSGKATPEINVAAPNVTIESPTVDVTLPEQKPASRWVFKHTYNGNGRLVETVATRE
jgi:hypothetical protein